MSVRAERAISVTYTVAGFATLVLALVLLSTGTESSIGRTLVVLGSAVCGLLSIYYLFGGGRHE